MQTPQPLTQEHRRALSELVLELAAAEHPAATPLAVALRALPPETGPPCGEPEVDVSVVVPVFNETENIPELYRRLTETLQLLGEYEILFVNDGSRDATPEMVRALRADDPRVKLIEFSRNFGHQAAVTAGVDYARGRAVVLIDADLQDPPELLTQMVEAWHGGAEVVYMVRRKRKEGWIKRACYAGFYRLLRALSSVEIPLDAGDFCLMDRRVVRHLRSLPERNRFLRGLRSWLGFRQVAITYERQARFAGEPKYTFRKLVRLALDGLVSFSTLPLRLATLLGFLTSGAGLLYMSFVVVLRLVSGRAPEGWTSTVVLVLMVGGIQLGVVGVLGEYVARIYDESKRRPVYVIREFLN